MVRTLRRDYARYSITGGDGDYDDETGDDAGVDENGKPLLDEEGKPLVKNSGGGGGSMPTEDSGWKQVHGDVFLFALAGPIHGEVHEDRGEMEQAILCCYCLS